jgi:hypothetical protein
LPYEQNQFLSRCIEAIGKCAPFSYHQFQYDYFDYGKPGMEEARKYRYQEWAEWCGTAYTKTRPPVALRDMSAKSGALAYDLTRAISFDWPIFAEARDNAYVLLTRYYNFDDKAPILAGKSLRYRADAYFDTVSVTLTRSPTVWDNSIDEYKRLHG